MDPDGGSPTKDPPYGSKGGLLVKPHASLEIVICYEYKKKY